MKYLWRVLLFIPSILSDIIYTLYFTITGNIDCELKYDFDMFIFEKCELSE